MTQPAVRCPCCHRELVPGAEVPWPRTYARPDDLWCAECDWLFAAKMLAGEDPMALDGL